VILTRETKFNMVLDFTAGTIGYVDYVGFLQGANEDYMDVSGFPTEDNDGNPFLMQCTRTMILYGDMTILDLKKYNIPMVTQDGKYLLPLQTLSAWCTQGRFSRPFNCETGAKWSETEKTVPSFPS